MANEGIELEVYGFEDPMVLKNVLPDRIEPSGLNELAGVGGGSFKLSIHDPKIIADPTLRTARNVFKLRIDGRVAHAWLGGTRKTSAINEKEAAGETYDLGGSGLKAWFDDARVDPYGGLQANSRDTRSFSFASERGEWYDESDWVTPFIVANVLAAPWNSQPEKWPLAPDAKWIWGESYSGSAPIGSCFFRYEFTTGAETKYAVYAAGDNTYSIHIDGERLMVSDPRYSASAEAAKVEFSVPAGDHVLAIEGRNNSGKAGVIASMFSVVGDIETLVTYTGATGWLTNPYPAQTPGWSAAEILLTLMAEAEDRGVRFPTYLTPTFTVTHDSNGNLWDAPLPWSFPIGASLLSVVNKMEELVCDIWIDPDTYELNMVPERGVDRTGFIYDVDGITPLSTPVIFEKGKNLRVANTESRGKIKNSISVRTGSGWLTEPEVDEDSIGVYGVIESTLDTGTSEDLSRVLAQVILGERATEEEGASYDIIATDKIPGKDFQEGDWVLAPNEIGLLVPRKVMSISSKEGEAGEALYTIEFDTIFQDNETRLSSIVSKMSGGGVGSSYNNASGSDGSTGGPIIITPPPLPPIKTPKAPENLDATSVGNWSPNGVTPYSDVTLTWDDVTENTDGTPTIPQYYDVWAHLTSAGDGAYQMYARVTENEATMRFDAGTQWTFKVQTRNETRTSVFSDEFDYLTIGPTDPLPAPDTPILSSNKGVLIVGWNGQLDSDVPPPQFRYVYAEVAEAGTGIFTQMGGVFLLDSREIYISGLVVNDAYDVQLIAVDGAGIASAPSSIATTTIMGVDLGDLDESVGDAIDAANEAALAAASSGNLLLAPSFEAGWDIYWTLETPDVTHVTTTPRTEDYAIRIASDTSAYAALTYNVPIPVDEGQEYLFILWLRPDGASPVADSGIEMGILYGDDLGSITTYVPLADNDPGIVDYTQIAGIFVTPANTKWILPRVWSRDVTGTNAYLVDDLALYVRTPNGLIVDGAITTIKLSAEAVTADKIAADSITALHIQAAAVTAGKIAAGAVTANEIAANTITAANIAAGSITALELSAEVGQDLDISSNNSVNIIAGQISTVTDDLNTTSDSLATMQTYYQFGPSGATISSPSSPYSLHLANDRIEILEVGVPVSYWNSGTMYVRSMVGEEIILGNHKIQKRSDGTVVREL